MGYWLVKLVLTPLLRLGFRVRCERRDVVPRRGPVILASNHRSFIDSLFLPLTVRRRVTFVAKAEYFESWKTAWFFRAVGMIPLKREGGSASERALAAAREVLQGGGVLGIYPEGTRSPDGRLYRGHTGVARLSIQCGAPVVPVAQLGTSEIQPIGAMWPRLFRPVTVRMGTPLRWEGATASADPEVYRRFTDEIMGAIQRLSGQEQASGYATRDLARGSAPGSEAEPTVRPVIS
jgi:1-acyl-sn-glycerol-3-phosphate acyltransferase